MADDDDSVSICAAAKRGEQWRILFYQRFPRHVSIYLSRLGPIVKAPNDEELKYINRSWYFPMVFACQTFGCYGVLFK